MADANNKAGLSLALTLLLLLLLGGLIAQPATAKPLSAADGPSSSSAVDGASSSSAADETSSPLTAAAQFQNELLSSLDEKSGFVLLKPQTSRSIQTAAINDTFIEGDFAYTILSEPDNLTSWGTVALAGFANEANEAHSISVAGSVTHGGIVYHITRIGAAAFFGKHTLYSVDFSAAENVTVIERNAFASCDLRYDSANALTLPANLVTISGASQMGAFQSNPNLEKVNLAAASKLEVIGECAFMNCGLNYPFDATETDSGYPLTFPATLRRINASAFFSNKGLQYVSLSKASSLVTIGENAFRSCDLRASSYAIVSIPEKVQSIESGAFADNKMLAAIDFSYAWELKTIKAYAFAQCGIASRFNDSSRWRLCLPPNVEYIGKMAFGGEYLDGEPYINVITAVTFTGKTAPELHPQAFTTIVFDEGGEHYPHYLKGIYVPPSVQSSYAELAASFNVPIITYKVTPAKLLLNYPDISATWEEGTAEPKTILVKLFSDTGNLINASGHLGIPVSISDVKTNKVVGETYGHLDPGHSTCGITIPADVMASLSIGEYKVMATGVPMSEGHDYLPKQQVYYFFVEGLRNPHVSGNNIETRAAGQEADFTPTVNLEEAFPEAMELECSLKQNETTILSDTLSVSDNGEASFDFSAAQMATLLPGSYTITVSSSGSTHNSPIADTSVGSLTVEKAKPALSANASPQEAWGACNDVAVDAQLSAAVFADAESLPLIAKIMDGDDVCASAFVGARASGDVTFTFDGDDLNKLEIGSYAIVAQSSGSANNSAIAATAIGTLTIAPHTPSISCTLAESRIVGSAQELSVPFIVSDMAAESEASMPLACDIMAGETSLARASVSVQADGAATLVFDAATMAALPVGSFDLVFSGAGSAHNAAIAPTQAGTTGTINLAAYAPTISGYTQIFHAVGVEAAASFSFELAAAYKEDTSLDCSILDEEGSPVWTDTLSVSDNGAVTCSASAATMAALELGFYTVTVSAPASEHNAAIPQTTIGDIVVHLDEPNVTGNVAEQRLFGVSDNFTPRVMLSGVYEGEAITLFCIIESSDEREVASSVAMPNSSGVVSFWFKANDMQSLLEDNYKIFVYSEVSAHNAAIPKTQVGTLDITSWQPSLDVNVNIERLYGQSEALVIPATIADLAPGDSGTLAAKVYASNGSIAMTKTYPGIGNGNTDISFSAADMAALEPDTYTLGVGFSGAAHSTDIPEASEGTIIIDRWQPEYTGANTIVKTLGYTSDINVLAKLTDAYGTEVLPTVDIVDKTGSIQARKQFAASANGQLTLSFAAAELSSLEPGDYTLKLSSQDSSHNRACAATEVGTLSIKKFNPLLWGGGASETRQVRTFEDWNSRVLWGMWPETITLTYELESASGVALSKTEELSSGGYVYFPFSESEMAGLSTGSYQMFVSAPEGRYNLAVEKTALASLSIQQYAPSVSGSLSLSAPNGYAKDISGTLQLHDAYLNNGMTAQLAVEGTNVKATAVAAADGSMTFSFADAAIDYLAAGEYKLVFSSAGDAENEAIAATYVGTLSIAEASAAFVGSDIHTRGSGQTLVFRITTNPAYLASVSVDGVQLTSSQMRVEEGSTLVILEADYLDTLTSDKHTLAVSYDTPVSAQDEFTVVDAPHKDDDGGGGSDSSSDSSNAKTLPRTGDSSLPSSFAFLAAVLALLGTASIALSLTTKKSSRDTR